VSLFLLDNLTLLADALTVAACVSVCAAILWHSIASRRNGNAPATVQAMASLFVVAMCIVLVLKMAASDLIDDKFAPLCELIVALAMVALGTAVWPLVPRMLALPSHRSLIEANRRLSAERAAREATLRSLQELNAELERRVADRTRDLERTTHRFETALEGSPITVAEQDRDLRYIWMFNPPAALRNVRTEHEAADAVLPKSTADAQAETKRRVMQTGVAERFEVALPSQDQTYWFEGRVEPVSFDGKITGTLTIAIDISEHKRHELEMQDVMRELSHRSKNLLAIVQGIARQTAVDTESIATFREEFTGRLHCLSCAHELLVENTWRGVELQRLSRRLVELFAASVADRIQLDGINVTLLPEASQTVALCLHELMTNALLQGSLGESQARASLVWMAEPDGGLSLLWQEQGTVLSGRLDRRGFGMQLLRQIVPRSLQATSELSAANGNLNYRLAIPKSQFVDKA